MCGHWTKKSFTITLVFTDELITFQSQVPLQLFPREKFSSLTGQRARKCNRTSVLFHFDNVIAMITSHSPALDIERDYL